MSELGSVEFPHRETKMKDAFVKREIDEAIEKVVEFA
jgi:hypothetical protein